ncbi:hypothetical protein [Marisediminitalea sp.]|uniref:hypothetical protein n=1 Tax=Marisediminitalea sp. TaxID=2662268 RepID=UPI0035172B60
MPTELFTFDAITTLAGATGAVFVISNGCQLAFNFNPKWLGLLIAQAISMVGVLEVTDMTIGNAFLAFINGFLIYSSAAGVTSMASSAKRQNKDTTRSSAYTSSNSTYPSKRQFLTPWF